MKFIDLSEIGVKLSRMFFDGKDVWVKANDLDSYDDAIDLRYEIDRAKRFAFLNLFSRDDFDYSFI